MNEEPNQQTTDLDRVLELIQANDPKTIALDLSEYRGLQDDDYLKIVKELQSNAHITSINIMGNNWICPRTAQCIFHYFLDSASLHTLELSPFCIAQPSQFKLFDQMDGFADIVNTHNLYRKKELIESRSSFISFRDTLKTIKHAKKLSANTDLMRHMKTYVVGSNRKLKHFNPS